MDEPFFILPKLLNHVELTTVVIGTYYQKYIIFKHLLLFRPDWLWTEAICLLSNKGDLPRAFDGQRLVQRYLRSQNASRFQGRKIGWKRLFVGTIGGGKVNTWRCLVRMANQSNEKHTFWVWFSFFGIFWAYKHKIVLITKLIKIHSFLRVRARKTGSDIFQGGVPVSPMFDIKFERK